jgi:hypothetical protein
MNQQGSLRRRLERVESRASQSTMPGIRIVFCHARDGRPTGVSVFGPGGRLVWLEPPAGCREGELVPEEDQLVPDRMAA